MLLVLSEVFFRCVNLGDLLGVEYLASLVATCLLFSSAGAVNHMIHACQLAFASLMSSHKVGIVLTN
jgi:hypothetical protein